VVNNYISYFYFFLGPKQPQQRQTQKSEEAEFLVTIKKEKCKLRPKSKILVWYHSTINNSIFFFFFDFALRVLSNSIVPSVAIRNNNLQVFCAREQQKS